MRSKRRKINNEFIDNYLIETYSLDVDGNIGPLVDTATVASTTTDYIISGLDNGIRYVVKIFSKNANGGGIYSSGITSTIFPKTSNGPKEVENVILSQSQNLLDLNGITLTLSWDFTKDITTPSDRLYRTMAKVGSQKSFCRKSPRTPDTPCFRLSRKARTADC